MGRRKLQLLPFKFTIIKGDLRCIEITGTNTWQSSEKIFFLVFCYVHLLVSTRTSWHQYYDLVQNIMYLKKYYGFERVMPKNNRASLFKKYVTELVFQYYQNLLIFLQCIAEILPFFQILCSLILSEWFTEAAEIVVWAGLLSKIVIFSWKRHRKSSVG